jgi:hypothetical protein
MDETVSDTQRNTCAASYVSVNNFRLMVYLVLKFI